MFQMLAEVIGAEEFLRLVTFAEFMHLSEMTAACFPIRMGEIIEFDATVATEVGVGECVRGRELAVWIVGIIRQDGGGGVECSIIVVG